MNIAVSLCDVVILMSWARLTEELHGRKELETDIFTQ